MKQLLVRMNCKIASVIQHRCQTINYKLRMSIPIFPRERLGEYPLSRCADVADPLSDFYRKAASPAVRCLDYVLSRFLRDGAPSTEDSLVDATACTYTLWFFEIFLSRYPIERHLSLKGSLDDVSVCAASLGTRSATNEKERSAWRRLDSVGSVSHARI
jgi:hypothetical protein